MPLVAAQCTNCGAALQVDNAKEAAVCQYCGSAFIVEKAIHNYEINNTYQIENANIIVNDETSFAKRMEAAEEYLYKLQEYDAAYKIFCEIESLAPTNYKLWYGKISSQTRDFNPDAVADIVVNHREAYENMKRDFINAERTAMGEEKAEIRKKIVTLLKGAKAGVQSMIDVGIKGEKDALNAQRDAYDKEIQDLYATIENLSKRATSSKRKSSMSDSVSHFSEILLKIGLFLGIPFLVFGISMFIAYKDNPQYSVFCLGIIAFAVIPLVVFFVLYKVFENKWFKHKQSAEDDEKSIREHNSTIVGKNDKKNQLSEKMKKLEEKGDTYRSYIREVDEEIVKYQK